jgi:hypothetical protein
MADDALRKVKDLLGDAGDAAGPALSALGGAMEGAGEAAEFAASDASAIASSLAAACADKGPAVAAQVLAACNAAGEEGSAICGQLFALLRHGLADAGQLAGILADSDAAAALGEALGDSLGAVAEGGAALAALTADMLGPDTMAALGDAADAAGAIGYDAASAVGNAAMAGSEAVADAAGDIDADAVGDAAYDAASAVGDAAIAAGGALADGAGDVYEAMGPALDDLRGAVTWEALDDAYTMSMDGAQEALQVLAGAGAGCLAAVDMLDLEILRDALQQVGLFFSMLGSAAFGGVSKVFGKIGNLVAVDLNYVVPDINPETMLVLLLVFSALTMVVGGCFLRHAFNMLPSHADNLEQGAEAIDFEALANDNPRTMKYTKYALTALGFIYLPVSKIVIQVLHCDYRDPAMAAMREAGYKCDSGGARFAAVLGLVFVTLGLPLAFRNLVNKAKPVGSLKDPDMCYDDDGVNYVPFTDRMYQRRIKEDPAQVHSPFVFLYKGFERRWSHYKSVVMFFKFLLVVPCVVFVGNLEAQAVVSLLVLIGYAALCHKAAPYIDGRKDKSEAIGRFAACLTVLFALIAGQATAATAAGGAADPSGKDKAMRFLVFATNIVSFGSMGLLTLMGFGCVKKRIQNWHKHVSFSDSVTDAEGDAPAILPQLDAVLEVRHRVWWPFWDGLLAKGYSADVAHRLGELKRATVNDGLAAIQRHWAGESDAEFKKWRAAACGEVEGVDVFWDGKVGPGDDAPGTKFGKMYVKRYPFEAAVVYDTARKDGSHAVAFLDSPDDIARLVRLQRGGSADGEVQRIREARSAIRAQIGQRFPLAATATITKRVPDGSHQVQSTDSEGHTTSRTVQDYSNVRVSFSFQVGTLALKTHDDTKEFQAGFAVTLNYADGTGSARKPRTGKMASFSGEHWTMGHGALVGTSLHVGGNKDGRGGRLDEMLGANPVQDADLAKVAAWREGYRAKLHAAHMAKEATLPSSFWYMVYANDKLDAQGLADWLASDHADPDGGGDAGAISNLLTEHESGLSYLFARMTLARINAVATFWLAFWENVWANNSQMDEIAANGALLDPTQRTAVAYRPMSRSNLEAALGACSPAVLSGAGSAKLLSPALLDVLYAELGRRSNPNGAAKAAMAAHVVASGVVPSDSLESILVVQPPDDDGDDATPQQHPASARFVESHEDDEPLDDIEHHEHAQDPEPIAESRFNEAYYCNVLSFAVDLGEGRASVTFSAHGDGSLGPLQGAELSSLCLDGEACEHVEDHLEEVSEGHVQGTLVYTYDGCGEEEITFSFGESGYSAAELPQDE